MPLADSMTHCRTHVARACLVVVLLCLSGCDLIDALLADPKAIQRDADAKAIGSACRHGLRSLEDCFAMNDKASKAAIFAGWKDMDQYMRDNKIEGVEPKGLKTPAPPVVAADETIIDDTKGDAKGDKKPAKPKPGTSDKG